MTRTRPECPVEINIDTLHAFDCTTGARLQGEAYMTALTNCGAVGATAEDNSRARDKAAQAAAGLLKKVFAR